MKALVEAQLYRDAGAVKRYHTKRTHRTQTVAEHTFGMLILLKQVCGGSLSPRVVNAVLHHDLPELFTGDIPAPIKRSHSKLGPLLDEIETQLEPLYIADELEPAEAALVKWADRVELVLWCLEEYRMGNVAAGVMASRGMSWVLQAPKPVCCRELDEQIVMDMTDLGLVIWDVTELEKNA